MISQGNNGNGVYFRSEAGARIYDRIMRTNTGARIARQGAVGFAGNFDATQRIKHEIEEICDSMLLREGETLADNYTSAESLVVYAAKSLNAWRLPAIQWANGRAKERVSQRKSADVNARLESLVGHCAELTSNCDSVLEEIDQKSDSATKDFYGTMERAKNLRTVLDEYESRVSELGQEIAKCDEKDYQKRFGLERELSGLRRDHSGVVAELDDASFKVQMGKKELDELDNTLTYLSAVRANNAKSGQRFGYLLAQAKRKQYNLSPLIVDSEKLVEGDQLARDQARSDELYSRAMGSIVDLISSTFGAPLPPSKDSVKEFRKKRAEDVERVKKEFEGLVSLEQERLGRLLEP